MIQHGRPMPRKWDLVADLTSTKPAGLISLHGTAGLLSTGHKIVPCVRFCTVPDRLATTSYDTRVIIYKLDMVRDEKARQSLELEKQNEYCVLHGFDYSRDDRLGFSSCKPQHGRERPFGFSWPGHP